MSNTLYYVIFFALIIAMFYFMAIRPQQKQRRAHQELMSTLKRGDQVMTASGIYGTVKRVEETVVVIEIAKGVTMKVARRAIADIVRDTAKAKAVAPEGPSGAGVRRRPRALERSSEAREDSREAEFDDNGEQDSDDSSSTR